jgi:hypothetical protein
VRLPSVISPAGQSTAYISVYGYSAASFTINVSWVAP